MVSDAVPKPIAVPKSASDRFFFSGMAIGMALVVFIGFACTYYLSAYFGTHGTIGGRPFSPIVRVHAMLFTTWVLLFVAQTSLVATQRVAIHRRLGVAVGVVAAIMIVVGTAMARDLARGGGAPAGIDPRAFLAVPLREIEEGGVRNESPGFWPGPFVCVTLKSKSVEDHCTWMFNTVQQSESNCQQVYNSVHPGRGFSDQNP